MTGPHVGCWLSPPGDALTSDFLVSEFKHITGIKELVVLCCGDQCPSGRDILVTNNGLVLTNFILDMDCVAGPTVSQLGSTKIPQGCRPSYENLMWLVGKHHYIISS